MAKANLKLIKALRGAAKQLEAGESYQWGHMGSCNCGHLAQQLTHYSRSEIHEYAMRKYGDWTEQVNDYCPTSGLTMDLLISELIDHGLSREDLKNLERLKDPEVRRRLGGEQIKLRHNFRPDVVKYMKAWADVLEEQLLSKVAISGLEEAEVARTA